MRSYVKIFSIMICCFFVFAKLLNIKVQSEPRGKRLFKVALVLFFCICVTAASYIFLTYLPEALLPFCILSSILFFVFSTKLDMETITTTIIISYGISNLLLVVSTFIVGIIAGTISSHDKLDYNILQILVFVLQMLLSVLIFKIRRLKNGMPFLKYEKNTIPGLLISLSLLFTCMIIYNGEKNFLRFILCTITFLLTVFIFLWWRRQITANYIDELKSREFEELKKLLLEKDKLINSYKEEHEKLTELIHKDNKLIPAMELAVREAVKKESAADKEKETELLTSLEALSRERKGIVASLDANVNRLPLTGCLRLDVLANYMRNKAIQYKLSFEFICDSKISFDKIVDTSDFCTLFADLVENAIIASREAIKEASKEESKGVRVIIGCKDENLFLELFDSGNPFNLEVLHKLGHERITTHANESGTGIGLPNCFTLLRKYSASLCIEQFKAEQDGYTKRITISFDKQHDYVLKAVLSEQERSYLSDRGDLTIITM